MREAQVVSLWEFEWEEVQERERWEVGEVEVGRGIASREVATASPLSVHFIEVDEALTCNVDSKKIVHTCLSHRYAKDTKKRQLASVKEPAGKTAVWS